MSRTIGILSLKGGVGKTSVVVALGAAIAELGKKVLLIDGNFSAPNLGLHLNIISPDTTIHHVLNEKANVRDSIHKMKNFDIIPASIFKDTKTNPLKLKDKIKRLKKEYDIILIDSSPALNEETLSVMLASDEVFVVSTPDHPTISTTLKAVKTAKRRGVNVSGLVLNKVRNKDFELSIDEVEYTAEVPVLAVIPEDVNVVKSLSEFKPSTIHKPNSKGSVEYRKLAETLIGEKKKTKFNVKNLFNQFRKNPTRQDVNREVFYESVFGS